MMRNDFGNITEEALKEQTESQFLREHIELKGFLPLAEIYEVCFIDSYQLFDIITYV